jgi:hypothetical protein
MRDIDKAWWVGVLAGFIVGFCTFPALRMFGIHL